jgi:hypothetical protein
VGLSVLALGMSGDCTWHVFKAAFRGGFDYQVGKLACLLARWLARRMLGVCVFADVVRRSLFWRVGGWVGWPPPGWLARVQAGGQSMLQRRLPEPLLP